MKNFIINVIGKYLGINKFLGAVNGYGSHIAGASLMLMGASLVLSELVPVLALQNPAALTAFLSSLPSNPGAHKFLEGLAIIRLRMAVAKQSVPAPESPKP